MTYYHLFFILYSLFFIFITWNNFTRGLFIFFLLLPTYLIRFNIGPLPTTLLEVMFSIITIVWLIRYLKPITQNLKPILKNHKLLFISTSLFLLSATISIFTSSDTRSAQGEWKAFYVEPILLFLILISSIKQNTNKIAKSKIFNFQFSIFPSARPSAPSSVRGAQDEGKQLNNLSIKQLNNPVNCIIFGLILSGLITSMLAIYQHFTGWLVPEAFWQNQNTFRVTAWYGFPNAVGLFLAPLVPLTIYMIKNLKNTRIQDTNNIQHPIFNIVTLISCILFLLSAPLAIIFAKSTGALVGLVAGIGFLLLIYKKTRWYTLAVGIIGLISLFSFPGLSGLKNEILLQDRSGQIRISIWHETVRFLKDNPIRGAGLASYTEKIQPYHTTLNGEGIEIFHHPHNIFLTMYVNLGLLGLISFIAIIISLFLIPYSLFNKTRNVENETWNNLPIYLTTSLIIILIMGLVDSPYIKNDLAILFWLLPALLLISQYELEKPKT